MGGGPGKPDVLEAIAQIKNGQLIKMCVGRLINHSPVRGAMSVER